MKPLAIEHPRRTQSDAAESAGLGAWVNRAAAAFWVSASFTCARRTPWFMRAFRPVFVWFAARCSGTIRDATAANARRILGPGITPRQCRRFARGVTASFYDFIYDIGRSTRLTRKQIFSRVESIEGHDRYVRARASRRGAIIATAHMGSFEVGMAALREMEERVHVVFQHDANPRFESIRRQLREQLGVIEAPVEEGWGLWMRLRDALKANEVVAMQADRVMPGQKGERVPFLGHHILLPSGPVKLAIASGAPIIPIFSIRAKRQKICITVEEPIVVDPDAADVDGVHPALLQLARVLEKQLRKHPEQWLMIQPAFCEDNE